MWEKIPGPPPLHYTGSAGKLGGAWKRGYYSALTTTQCHNGTTWSQTSLRFHVHSVTYLVLQLDETFTSFLSQELLYTLTASLMSNVKCTVPKLQYRSMVCGRLRYCMWVVFTVWSTVWVYWVCRSGVEQTFSSWESIGQPFSINSCAMSTSSCIAARWRPVKPSCGRTYNTGAVVT